MGFALYDTGYGVCETVFQSFYKRLASFVVSLTAFTIVAFSTDILTVHNLPTLVLNLALLTVLTHIVTAMSKSIAYSCTMAALVGGLIYPVLHNMMQRHGIIESTGFFDAAGSGVVHFVGAVIAFILSLYFSKVRDWRGLKIKSPALASLGFLCIWAAWLLFTLIISAPLLQADPSAWLRGLVNVSTTAAWGAASSVVFTWVMLGKAKMKSCTIGGLAGLVIVSAVPFSFTFIDALTFGIMAGVLAATAAYALHVFDLKDPCNVIAVHGPAGVVTLLAVPFIDGSSTFISQLHGMLILAGLSVVASVIICEVLMITHGAVKFAKLKNLN
ncbi:Ammonium Transporter Family protein [compost metagenome]